MCFLTNGGGVTEAHKAAELSDWLGISVGADQVSHDRVLRVQTQAQDGGWVYDPSRDRFEVQGPIRMHAHDKRLQELVSLQCCLL